jgi:histidine ammonia-lyase
MIELDGQRLALEEVYAVARGEKARLAGTVRPRMEASRAVIERIVAENRVVYGVNTGFGKLADYTIGPAELRQLQLNLVRSHACGVGTPLPEAEVRAMLLLRANVLALGFSGARFAVAETLAAMLEQGVHPVVPERGSVGASGDLAPLAHLAMCAIGEGEAFLGGERLHAGEALRRANIAPLELDVKEGLALLNGTQAMCAVGGLAVLRAERLVRVADAAGAATLEALLGTPVAFNERIHRTRPQFGQLEVAEHLRDLLDGSEIRQSHVSNDPRIQDAYSLRCMPQVHGAVRGALRFARETVEVETGSGTDNPLVFAGSDEVLSGGNFHGAPLGYAFDLAAIALADLASISERRIDRLVNPDLNEGLPPFLTTHPGTSSGYMIAHVTAVGLLNEMKVLAHPASVDNVPTSGGKEDHVSMGMTAALKLRRAVDACEHVLAIELMAACEALEYRRPLRSGRGVERLYARVRERVPKLLTDRSLSRDIEAMAAAIRDGVFDSI